MVVWVVLAAYNEEAGLPPLVKSLSENFVDDRREYKIIVVNDGSTDQTQNVILELSKTYPVKVINLAQNSGLAEALKTGLLEAARVAQKNDIIVTMDADNTHPAGLSLRMIRTIREGSDVVIASRYVQGSAIMGLSHFRKVLSFGASIIFRIFFPIHGVKDYTCGYRAYKAEVLKSLYDKYQQSFISETGFSCMVDILLKLRKLNLVFVEVPLILRYDQKVGRSKMKIITTIFATLRLLARRRLGWE